MNFRTMKKLSAQTSEEVLLEQVSLFEEMTTEGGVLPIVRVNVGTEVYRGTLLKTEIRHNERWAVLATDRDAIYFRVRDVLAVVVENVREADMSEPPSRLSIERHAKEVSSELANLGWAGAITFASAAADDKEAHRNVSLAIAQLKEVLSLILADKMGRGALTSVTQIQILGEPGARLSAERAGAILKIIVGADAKLKPSSVLRELVENKL